MTSSGKAAHLADTFFASSCSHKCN